MITINGLKRVRKDINYIILENKSGIKTMVPVDDVVYNQFKYFIDKLTINPEFEGTQPNESQSDDNQSDV